MESKYFKGNTDLEYLQFNKKLIQSSYPMEGVRLPVIRQIAKAYKNDAGFLAAVPCTYEEVMMYGFVLALSDFDISGLIQRTGDFLPYIDNWGVCDCFAAALKKFGKHKTEVLAHFTPLKDSQNVFDRRFLAVILMDYFFTDEYIDTALDLLTQIRSGDYYVDMAIAWAIATAAAKYFDKAYAVMTSGCLNPFIIKKSISKSLESFRVTAENKQKLKDLRNKLKE